MSFSKLWRPAVVAVLLAILALLVYTSEAQSRTKACQIDEFCITHGASKKSAKSGQVIFFTVKLRNLLNDTAQNLTVRYVTPRQVLVRAVTTPARRLSDDQLQWRIKSIDAGGSWTVKIKVLVLSYAPKQVANRAMVFVGTEKWLDHNLGYKILDSTSG